jgi:tetratricopeptide (TPR) repeat protein
VTKHVFYFVAGSLAIYWLWQASPKDSRPESDRPSAPARARSALADRRSSRPISLAQMLETLRPASTGLCGTEIAALEEKASTEIPRELRSLTSDKLTPDQIATVAQTMGVELPAGADPTSLARAALEERSSLEALISDPVDPEDGKETWAMRSDVLRELGRTKEAVEAARSTFAKWPSAQNAELLALALDEGGEPEIARRTLEGELGRTQTDADRAWLHAQLGFICATRGDEKCAARNASDLEKLKGHESIASFTLAVQQTFRGQLDEARAAYEKSLTLSRDPVALSNLGEVEACAGRLGQARSRFLEALEQHRSPSTTTSALAGLAYTHLREGDIVSSWLYGASALAGAQGSTHASLARGTLALSALVGGDLEEARHQARQARQADPNDDLTRRRCFGHPAEAAAARALHAEAKGDRDSARTAWIEVARGGHQALSLVARRALGELCR